MFCRRLVGGLCALFLFVSNAGAKESFYSKTEVTVIPETESVSPASPLQVMVKIEPKNDWHIYWNNPGDTGIPTVVNLQTDFGRVVLRRQSSPKYFLQHNIITQYAYDSPAYWLFEIIPDENKKWQVGQHITLALEASWQACRDECLDEKINDEIVLPVSYQAVQDTNWEKERLKAQHSFPKQTIEGMFFLQDDKIFMQIPRFDSNSKKLHLIPNEKDILINKTISQVHVSDDYFYITASFYDEALLGESFEGVLTDNKHSTRLFLHKTETSFPLPVEEEKSLTQFLVMAFLGGLILNLMPCIFPILFIKAMHLINSAYSRQKVSSEALLYFCGVLFCFIFAAVLLWLLQSGGAKIGWGFQLQSPVFVFILLVMFFIIGLMFLDVIHFNVSVFNRLAETSVRNTKLNAFLTGLFAVLIASPCSAPFMGAAIGYSITQPFYIYLPIFIALGIGYALPFTLIGLFPHQLARFLPKPGAWMNRLKKIFAIPVFMTCIWLGWILYHQISPSVQAERFDSSLEWETFSPAKLKDLQSRKQPVFIDFTAKWCLTCLVNEQTALSSVKFRRLVKEKNIALLKADWTNKDADITTALAIYQRNSVPLYVYYNGKDKEPIILPQLLTPQILGKYLR